MGPISNSDRLVQLLRQKLQQRTKARKSSAKLNVGDVQLKGLDAVKAVTSDMARKGGRPNALKRALIEQLLIDRFGSTLANEPRFQQIVDQVVQIMSEDIETAKLLESTITALHV